MELEFCAICCAVFGVALDRCLRQHDTSVENKTKAGERVIVSGGCWSRPVSSVVDSICTSVKARGYGYLSAFSWIFVPVGLFFCFESSSLFIINERIVVLFDLDFNHLLLSLLVLLSTVALKVSSPHAYAFDLGSQNSLKKVICKVSLNQDLHSHVLILFLSSSSFGIIC